MKKKILALALLILTIGVLIPGASSKTLSYYAGDAISYRGQLVVATTNTNNLEIWKLSGSTLVKVITLSYHDPIFGQPKPFYDVLLDIGGNGRLYAYASAGSSFYRYDITSLSQAGLALTTTRQVSNPIWDWYGRITKLDGNIVTVGAKGIKIWNGNLDTIDTFNFTNINNSYNVRLADNSRYILNINSASKTLEVFDMQQRQVVRVVSLNYAKTDGNHAAYLDPSSNYIYAIDDNKLKEFNLNGEIVNSFTHKGDQGFDVVPSSNGQDIYFSDGVGVVKMNKNNLQTVNYNFTYKYEPNSWAMGLKAVTVNGSEKLVVFDNANILVLDGNSLKKIAWTQAMAIDTRPVFTENLFLRETRTALNVYAITGGGFEVNEGVKVQYLDQTLTAKADGQGRFKANVLVPISTSTPTRLNVTATGVQSGKHYSIAFPTVTSTVAK